MSRALRRIVGDVLVRSAAGRPLEAPLAEALSGLGSPGADALLVAASRHGVTGLLGAVLEGDDRLPWVLRDRVQMARSRVVRDHLRAVAELAVLGDRLDASGVPWLLCKGPALATVVYPQPYLREYTDLDLLVPETEVPAALATLAAAGFTVTGPGLDQLHHLGAGEVMLRSPAGRPVDLHWDVVNDPRVRSAFRVPRAEVLLSRARRVDVHGRILRTFDPVDTLLHVALHAGTSGGWRLLWLRDVVQAADAARPFVEEVRARGRSWGVDLLLDVMAGRAARVLQVSADLSGAAPSRTPWLHVVAALDAVRPPQRATGRPSVSRIVTNATRRDTRTSVVELLRRTTEFSRNSITRLTR